MFFIVTVAGYFAAAGSLYWFLYARSRSKFALQKQTAASTWASIRSDVTLSVLSSGIFAICAAVMTAAYSAGYTRIYLQPHQHGSWYLGFSLLMIIFLQDAYFYFTHRLSHHPRCYKWLHGGHHHSKNPTPWTAFAFDPAEAMIQSVYLIGITILIPLHISVLVALIMVMTMGALIHHFGVRLFEDSAVGSWLGSWMVGCTHHWLHHRKYTVHYSLYFTFWDKVLGTQYEGYESILSSKSEPVQLEAVLPSKTISFPIPVKKTS